MKTLYTDAGYRWQDTEKDLHLPVVGRICVTDNEEYTKVEAVKVGRVPMLKQYNNVLELIAIARAVETAIEMGWIGSLSILTDSKVAMIWASSMKVNPKVETDAHRNALEYLRSARKNYGGIITFRHVPRNYNPAGIVLEKELLEKSRVVGINKTNISVESTA